MVARKRLSKLPMGLEALRWTFGVNDCGPLAQAEPWRDLSPDLAKAYREMIDSCRISRKHGDCLRQGLCVCDLQGAIVWHEGAKHQTADSFVRSLLAHYQRMSEINPEGWFDADDYVRHLEAGDFDETSPTPEAIAERGADRHNAKRAKAR